MLIPIDSLSLPSCPSCPSSFSLTTLCHRVSPPFLLDRGPGTQRSLLATGFPIPRTLYAASNRDYTTCLPDSYYALVSFSFFLSHFFIFSRGFFVASKKETDDTDLWQRIKIKIKVLWFQIFLSEFLIPLLIEKNRICRGNGIWGRNLKAIPSFHSSSVVG